MFIVYFNAIGMNECINSSCCILYAFYEGAMVWHGTLGAMAMLSAKKPGNGVSPITSKVFLLN